MKKFSHKLTTKDSKSLVEMLMEQTVDFKKDFITKTKNWADRYFDLVQERVQKYKTSKIADYASKAEYYDLQKKCHNEYYSIIRMGKEAYIEKMSDSAEKHYEVSIQKLALRVAKKDLNVNNIKVTSSKIGVNFECVISDDNKTVKAWTIIAEGPVQKPHYRYLIK